jgi:hypothetical protein
MAKFLLKLKIIKMYKPGIVVHAYNPGRKMVNELEARLDYIASTNSAWVT